MPFNKLLLLLFKHENSTGHLCPDCGESFRYKRKLRDHILVVHEGYEYECQFCKKKFNAKSSMQTHVRTIHEGRKPEPSKCSYVIDILRLKHKSKFIFEQCMRRSGLMLVNCVV